jgi:hypothetical protein
VRARSAAEFAYYDEVRFGADPGQVPVGPDDLVAVLQRRDLLDVFHRLAVSARAVEHDVSDRPSSLALGAALPHAGDVDQDPAALLAGRAVGVPDVVLPLMAMGAEHPVLLPGRVIKHVGHPPGKAAWSDISGSLADLAGPEQLPAYAFVDSQRT